jgi:hypothetical protein
MVGYFAVEGFSGQYFSCARYGTMSTGACVRNFAAAPQAVKGGRLEGCVGCQLGAQHSGKPAQPCVNPRDVSMHRGCVRCRRSGREPTSRLLGRMRLVRGHTICVSCYNREREFLHGANAKGAKPKKWSGLFMAAAGVFRDSKVQHDRFTSPVAERRLGGGSRVLRDVSLTGWTAGK